MSENTALSLTAQFPANKYNVLVPIQTVTEIADIQKPVLNVVNISTDLNDKEIYEQEKAKDAYKNYPARPALYALTKKGLLKLMRAAGIKILSSKAELPSTCQKCAAVNKSIGKPVNCGNCNNRDVKYTVQIIAPQLTGEDIIYECSREIRIADETAGMTPAQQQQFLKYSTEHCESKALNRALRAAMLIKPTYTIEELRKPFVVAYLAPNLNNPEVRQRAVESYFSNARAIYGSPEIEQVRRVKLDDDEAALPAADAPAEIPAEFVPAAPEPEPDFMAPAPEPDGLYCTDCSSAITPSGTWTPEAIAQYSQRRFGRVLCPACQRAAKQAQNR